MASVHQCSDHGADLVVMPASPEMLEASEGYRALASTWLRLKGTPIPVDEIQVGICPEDGCHNTYWWVNGDYPRIGLYPAEE